MNLTTIPPIKNIALLVAFSIACVTLAGCGNKGPLVKPSDIPPAAPAASTVPTANTEPSAEPVAEPDVTPVAESASGTPAAQR